MWNLVAAAHDQAGRPIARGLQTGVDGAHHEMRRIERNLTRALAFNLQLQTEFSCLDDNFVVKTERQPQAVEARAEVCAGGCDDSSGREPGGQGLIHQAQTSPSLATTATG